MSRPWQDWTGARIRTGAGGAGGGRGGDVGSHNFSDSSVRDSHNNNSRNHTTHGDNYEGPVDQGDRFNGPIDNSAVGGRGNTNKLNNYGHSGGQNDRPALSPRETEMEGRLAKLRERLAAKKELERLAEKEAELRRLEAELGED